MAKKQFDEDTGDFISKYTGRANVTLMTVNLAEAADLIAAIQMCVNQDDNEEEVDQEDAFEALKGLLKRSKVAKVTASRAQS